jgi:threonine/homoserine/homoserine lactone efflux protein
MLGIHDFSVFLFASVILILVPGQDAFYIMGRSVAQGRRAGLASVAGITTGLSIHLTAAVLGLSAILAAYPKAFFAVKLAGAAYLAYIGARMLFSRASGSAASADAYNAGFAACYRQGFITNILNPKVALFYLAFMPQFISTDSPRRSLAFLALGAMFFAMGTLWNVFLAWFAARLGDWMRKNTGWANTITRSAGALFIFLGLKLAIGK